MGPLQEYVWRLQAACGAIRAGTEVCSQGFDQWIAKAVREPVLGGSLTPPAPRKRSTTQDEHYATMGLHAPINRLIKLLAANDGMPDRCGPTAHAESPVKPQAKNSVDDDAEEQVILSPQRRARTGHLTDAALSPGTEAAAAGAAAPAVPLFAQAKDLCSRVESHLLVPSPCRATTASRVGRMALSPIGETGTPPMAPVVASASSWHSSALFAPPPPPLATTQVAGPTGAASAAVSNVVPGVAPTRNATPTRQRDGIASPSACDQPASFKEGVVDIVHRIEAPEAVPRACPEDPTPEPLKVSELRTRFEASKSTPCLRNPGAACAASLGNSRGDGAMAASTSSFFSPGVGASGPINAGSLFAPLQRPGIVRHKELFRARPPDDASLSSGPDSARGAQRQAFPRVGDGEHGETRNIANDAFGRLAAGSRRDDVAKPKSLKAAEQVRLQEQRQEQRKQRERQERERAKADEAGAQAAFRASRGGAGGGDRKAAAAAAAPPPPPPPPPAPDPSAARRRSAVMPDAKVETEAESGEGRGAGEAAPAGTEGGVAGHPQKGVLPPVPVFEMEPSALLRQLALSPPRAEDNYEISDPGGDSDADDNAARVRSGKHVPLWCKSYLDVLAKQADIDPDTIFDSKVPRCCLEDIFLTAMYRQAGRNRPKRRRGSSGDWHKDRLTKQEIQNYKTRMGHVRRWESERGASSTPVSGIRA